MDADDLLRRLRRLATTRGWAIEERPGGRHWKVRLNGKRTVIARHGGDIPVGTFRKISKDLDLTETDLRT
jgi:predicted RNA binding protein YcfA (HicA-like mRNA interferase family)